jgi:prepilin-type N-terminal cleavage/methylation domain-containing protein
MADVKKKVQDGFTLVEMMVALAILVFGVSALAGSLLTGVSMRRGSEMRFRADALVNQAVHRIQEEEFPKYSGSGEPLQGFTVEDPPGYSGMRYTVTYVTDLERPALVLARIKVSWAEQGERMGETFERILVRRVSSSRRVADLTQND